MKPKAKPPSTLPTISAVAPKANHNKLSSKKPTGTANNAAVASKAEEAKVKKVGKKKAKKIMIIEVNKADTEEGDGVKQKRNMNLKRLQQ